MFLTRDVEVDLATAASEFPFVLGLHVLELGAMAALEPDAYRLAVVLAPYDPRGLAQVHAAFVAAMHGIGVAGPMAYVDDRRRPPFMTKTRLIMPTPAEREAAALRIAPRRAAAPPADVDLELRFERQLTESGAWPIGARLVPGAVLEVVEDPFPSRKVTPKRVLVADPDPATARTLRELAGVEVTSVDDGWHAVDLLSGSDFDLVLCALTVGELPGAKILKLIVKERPHNAARIYFLAREETIASGPPSSASGRILARPITTTLVQAILDGR